MKPARLGVPLLVVAARHAHVRLSPELLQPLVARWSEEFSAEEWLIDVEAGLAIFRPNLRCAGDGGPGGMVLRGNLRSASADGFGTIEQLETQLSRDPVATLRDIRGDFALAHWDAAHRRLIVARDQLGRRTIFQRVMADIVLFCSEPTPLWVLPDESGVVVDRRSLFWFLAFGGPSPGASLVDGVTQLRAGHFLRWSPALPVEETRYWTPLGRARTDPRDPAFDTVVTERLGAALVGENDGERGFAIALSGGTDSSLLLALAVGLGHRPRFAANVRFETGVDANEDAYAAYVAREFGVPFKCVTLDARAGLSLFEQVIGNMPEPCAAWAAMSHAALVQGVREECCDHLCSGFGADEIFGGYDQYRIAAGTAIRAAARLGSAPGRALHDAVAIDPSGLAGQTFFTGIARFFNDAALGRSLHPPYDRWRQALWQRAFYEECYRLDPNAEPVQTMVAHECQHRIPDIVLKSFEPIAERYGVATAYPFLDPDLCRIATALTLTDRYRTPGGEFALDRRRLLPDYKWALGQVARTRLPPAIVARSRKSYTAPFALWMREPYFARRILEMIADSRLWELGMLRRTALDETIAHLEAGPGRHAHQLWCLLVLARWCDLYRAR